MGAIEKLKEIMEEEGMNSLEEDMNARVTGLAFGLGHTILTLVAQSRFDMAIGEIDNLKKAHKELPILFRKSERFLSHCKELVQAIKMKKSFPNISTLPLSKQEEMHDRIMDHFEELKSSLKKIDRMEADIRVQDARSSLWVVRTFAICTCVVVAFAIALEAHRTMGKPVRVILEDLSKMVFNLFGL